MEERGRVEGVTGTGWGIVRIVGRDGRGREAV